MPSSHRPLDQPRPFIVRLRNWVGDATLSVPTLQRLSEAGYGLQVIGKGWARDLLAGHGWPVHVLPASFSQRVQLLRKLRAEATSLDPGFTRRINTLCLPDSFSSALEFRVAGLRALGHAHEGRSLLLSQTLPLPRTLHALHVYWEMADALLGEKQPLPETIGLRVNEQQRARAQALMAEHGVASGFIAICPFAGGTWAQQDKTWPGFADFVAQVLPRFGRRVVVCPGPGEEAIAREQFASSLMLPKVSLGTYAALLQQSAMMIANDTGPGHMAAAVGTPLVSVLGPSDPALWRAWGPSVQLVQGSNGWPEAQAVEAAVARAFQAA
jgi:heptosyltransferase-2